MRLHVPWTRHHGKGACLLDKDPGEAASTSPLSGQYLVELRSVAEAAVAIGAGVLLDRRNRGVRDAGVVSKGRADWVTDTDKEVEYEITKLLRDKTPTVLVLAEEAGGAEFSNLPTWLVDPLDGTTNFMNGLPYVGISLALAVDQEPVIGVVAAPLLGRGWSAIRGVGAFDFDGNPLRVESGGGAANSALVATGSPFRHPEWVHAYSAVLEQSMHTFGDIRRSGAASLDLCYTAEGAYDGFFELGLAPWDSAAGILMVREAGGIISDWRGRIAKPLTAGSLLAGAPPWHATMLELIRTQTTRLQFSPPW
jgi:myo-inositol-1(or 4)-monophosphatase